MYSIKPGVVLIILTVLRLPEPFALPGWTIRTPFAIGGDRVFPQPDGHVCLDSQLTKPQIHPAAGLPSPTVCMLRTYVWF